MNIGGFFFGTPGRTEWDEERHNERRERRGGRSGIDTDAATRITIPPDCSSLSFANNEWMFHMVIMYVRASVSPLFRGLALFLGGGWVSG